MLHSPFVFFFQHDIIAKTMHRHTPRDRATWPFYPDTLYQVCLLLSCQRRELNPTNLVFNTPSISTIQVSLQNWVLVVCSGNYVAQASSTCSNFGAIRYKYQHNLQASRLPYILGPSTISHAAVLQTKPRKHWSPT